MNVPEDVTLLGIGLDNPYFPLELSDRMDEVVISSAMAQKYGIREGEEVTLRDEEAGRIYAFRVAGITQFAPAFYAFMDIDALYPLFISNVACAMDLSMSPLVYVGMYAIIVGLCFVIIQALQRKIHRISPAEILKHRE